MSIHKYDSFLLSYILKGLGVYNDKFRRICINGNLIYLHVRSPFFPEDGNECRSKPWKLKNT